jgi:hypothetical protein
VQQHLPQEVIREQVCQQAPSLTNNGPLKIATTVQQIITELSEDVSEEHKIMVITEMVHKRNGR